MWKNEGISNQLAKEWKKKFTEPNKTKTKIMMHAQNTQELLETDFNSYTSCMKQFKFVVPDIAWLEKKRRNLLKLFLFSTIFSFVHLK